MFVGYSKVADFRLNNSISKTLHSRRLLYRTLTPKTDFSGREAFDLYLKCLQLILRHQIWFLVQEKGLPAELETIVFDLWTLRIAQFGHRIPATNSEADLQSQSQIFSTLESEESDTTDHDRGLLPQTRRRERKLATAPNLKDCLALCYIGLLTLRLPITPGDIYAWAIDGKLAYQKAITYLPLAMRDRLPASYHDVLGPSTLLKYKSLYTTINHLQISFEKDHGILWPGLNAPLLLFRYLKELALPLELYDATLRLGELLGYDFALHHEGYSRLGIRHLPEAQLIGCLTVCVKLFYPFDDEKRSPQTLSEPTATRIDWKIWHKHMDVARSGQRGDEKHFNTEELYMLEEKEVFSMSSNQLDRYLDFYTDTFLDEAEIQRTKDSDEFRHALYEMFPIDGKDQQPRCQLSETLPHQERLEVVKVVHSSMEPVAAVPEEEAGSSVLRPGERYQSWKREQDVPGQAKKFFEEEAKLAGFSMDMFVMAVFFTETRIARWRKEQVRRQRSDEAMVDD